VGGKEKIMKTEEKIEQYIHCSGFMDWNSFEEFKNYVLEFCADSGIKVGEKRNKLIDDTINGLRFKAWEV
jgi:hypothetical protein